MSLLPPVWYLLALAVGAAAVLAALLGTAVRSGRLPASVASARRRGTATGVLAPVVATAATAVLLATDPLRPRGPGASLAAAPAAWALVHTLVLLAGELTWPRPRGSVRSALLGRRTIAGTSPVLTRWLFRASALLVAAVAVAGWATADGTGRAVGRSVRDGRGHVLMSASHGPYPGAAYAVPVLVALALVAVAVEGGLRVVTSRPAVAAAEQADERALRRAGAHRLLRGAAAGLLAEAGGLLVVGGLALHGLGQPFLVGAGGPPRASHALPVLAALGAASALLGGLCLAAAPAVLLVPAPRLRRRPGRRTAAPASRGVAA